jgi:hypothetical protein
LARRLGGDVFYDCDSCKARPAMYEMLGHDKAPTAYWKENLVDGKKLERCPLRSLQLADSSLVQEMSRHVNEYYPFYEDGHLLVAGGISDQPARTMAYMLEIRRLWNIVDEKYLQSLNPDEASE